MTNYKTRINLQKTPKVSVGLPVYNGEKFLKAALDSLLAQDFTDFELIISDNCSSDQTESICREYALSDSRVQYVRLDKNYGYAFNTQNVLDLARADYFMWASDDDLWDANWISTLLPKAIERQCLATGCYISINESGSENYHLANRRAINFCGNKILRRLKFFLEPGFLGKGCPFFGVMPTRLIREIGVSWLEHEPIGGDTVYLYVILKDMEIVCLPNVALYKRQHAQSLGEENSRIQIDSSKVKEGRVNKFIAILLNFFYEPIPGQYMAKSNAFEKLLIILLYPIAVIRVFCTAIMWRNARRRQVKP